MNLLDASTCKKVFEGVGGGKYYLINTLSDFNDFLKEATLQKYIAFDTETTGLNWVFSSVCGISIGWGVANNYYIPIAHKTDEKNLDIDLILPGLIELFGDRNKFYIGHNTKFDLHMLKKLGIDVKGVLHDTLIASWILNENEPHGLKELSNKYLHPDANKWEKSIKEFRKEEVKRRRKEYARRLDQMTTHYVRRTISMKLFLDPGEKAKAISDGEAWAKGVLQKDICFKNKLDDISYDYIPLNLMTPYAASDVHYTYLLFKKFIFDITSESGLKDIYLNEMQFNNELFLTERAGVYIDRAYLEKKSPELDVELEEHRKSVYKTFGREFNLDSTDELFEVLSDAGVKFTKLTKGSKKDREEDPNAEKVYSLDKEVLEDLARENEYARIILDYRKAQKNKGTYVDGILDLLDKDSYLHTNFNANVSTGRSSSTNPNLQNINNKDKIVKSAFVRPNDDCILVYMDYSQVELRLTAHHSLDPILLSCYPEVGEGKDVHAITGAEIVLGISTDKFNKMKGNKAGHTDKPDCACSDCMYKFARFAAKRVNFGIIYGVGPPGLAKQIPGNKTVEQCKQYIDGYLKHYRGVSKFIKTVKKFLKENEYVINSFGRKRRFPGYNKADFRVQGRMERQAVNFMIQGDGADLFKTAVVRVGKFLRSVGAKTRMSNFVHDEIQFYWHKDELDLIPKVKAIMEDFKFCVPIVAEVSYSDTSWADKKEWR